MSSRTVRTWTGAQTDKVPAVAVDLTLRSPSGFGITDGFGGAGSGGDAIGSNGGLGSAITGFYGTAVTLSRGGGGYVTTGGAGNPELVVVRYRSS